MIFYKKFCDLVFCRWLLWTKILWAGRGADWQRGCISIKFFKVYFVNTFKTQIKLFIAQKWFEFFINM